MRSLIFLAAIAIGFLAWKKREESQSRAAFARIMASANPCTGKDECTVFYVTPWCPTCKSLKPKLQRVLKTGYQDPSFGIRVVVGQGRLARENAAEAESYGKSGATDDQGVFQKQFDITYYPTVLLLDGHQKVVARGQVALNKMLSKAYPDMPVPPIPPGLPEGALSFP